MSCYLQRHLFNYGDTSLKHNPLVQTSSSIGSFKVGKLWNNLGSNLFAFYENFYQKRTFKITFISDTIYFMGTQNNDPA